MYLPNPLVALRLAIEFGWVAVPRTSLGWMAATFACGVCQLAFGAFSDSDRMTSRRPQDPGVEERSKVCIAGSAMPVQMRGTAAPQSSPVSSLLIRRASLAAPFADNLRRRANHFVEFRLAA